MEALTPAAYDEVAGLLKKNAETFEPNYVGKAFLALRKGKTRYNEVRDLMNAEDSKGRATISDAKDGVRAAKALLGRAPLPEPSRARDWTVVRAKAWLRIDSLLPEVATHFETLVHESGQYAPDEVRGTKVFEQLKTEQKVAGVYVITTSRFTDGLVKVGCSHDVFDRMKAAQTWHPEPLQVLAVYPCENHEQMEKELHAHLTRAGRPAELKGGGQEWFAVDLPLLDYIANSLGLKNEVGNYPTLASLMERSAA